MIKRRRIVVPLFVLAMLFASSDSASGADGTITFTSNPSKVRQGQTLSFHGTYVMTEDDTPDGTGVFGECPGSGSANFHPYWCCDSAYIGTHAEVYYKLDGVESGRIGYVYNYPQWPGERWSGVGTEYGFNGAISTSSMSPGSSHLVAVYFKDVYAVSCLEPNYGSHWEYGDTFAEQTFTFTVCQSSETCCNGIDDNCNDEVDEGCTECDCNPCCDVPECCAAPPDQGQLSLLVNSVGGGGGGGGGSNCGCGGSGSSGPVFAGE